jgi:hypothetical protein
MGDEIPQASCNRNFTTSFINDARNAWWNVKYPTLDDKYKNATGKTADKKNKLKPNLILLKIHGQKNLLRNTIFRKTVTVMKKYYEKK